MLIAQRNARIGHAAQLLGALSYRGVLARGFALVRDAHGTPLHNAAQVSSGTRLNIEFADGRAYRNHYHHLFTVRDGRVVGVREYLDLQETERVFGPMGGTA